MTRHGMTSEPYWKKNGTSSWKMNADRHSYYSKSFNPLIYWLSWWHDQSADNEFIWIQINYYDYILNHKMKINMFWYIKHGIIENHFDMLCIQWCAMCLHLNIPVGPKATLIKNPLLRPILSVDIHQVQNYYLTFWNFSMWTVQGSQ